MSGSVLTALSRGSLKESAVEQIRLAITRGELKAGERVTELGLARKLGVGQATIREALIDLEHQGFFQRSGLHKTFVTSLTRRDLNDIYQVRSNLEVLAIDLLAAAGVRTVEDAESAYQRMAAAAGAGDVAEFCAADLGFHRALWAATRNHALVEMLERLVPRIFALNVRRPLIFDRPKLLEIAADHAALLTLLRAGEYEAARETTRRMMEKARQEDIEVSPDSSS